MMVVTDRMSPALLHAIKELDHTIALLDGLVPRANEFYLEPSLAVIEYCRTIIRLAKEEERERDLASAPRTL